MNFSEDIEDHRQIKSYLFDAINDTDIKFSHDILSNEIIIYLNNIFKWDNPIKNYNTDASLFQYLKPNYISYIMMPPKIPLKIKLASMLIDISIAIIIFFMFSKLSYPIESFRIEFYYFLFYGLPFIWFDIKTPGQYIMKLKVLEEGDNEVAYTSHAASVIRLFLTIISIHTTITFINHPLAINFSLFIVLLNIYLLYTKSQLLQDLWGTKVYQISK